MSRKEMHGHLRDALGTALAVCLLLAGGCYRALEKTDASPQATAVKQRLLEIFELCARVGSADRLAAGGYFVYRGEDRERRWKDTLRADVESEREAILGTCESVNRPRANAGDPQFVKFLVERESEGEWNAWEVRFRKGDKIQRALYAFLLVRGRYALGDVDRLP